MDVMILFFKLPKITATNGICNKNSIDNPHPHTRDFSRELG